MSELWPPVPAVLTLEPASVHLWLVDLDRPATLPSILSADEQARAARFHFERDRQRYVAGRSSLRLILGRYLGVEPGQIRFDYTAYGRPLLAVPFAGSGLRFNASHAQSVYLLAVTRHREIGADVEAIRPLPDALDIAGRFFCPRGTGRFAPRSGRRSSSRLLPLLDTQRSLH